MNTPQLSDRPATSEGPYRAPNCLTRGSSSGSLFHPEGFSLWRVVGELHGGAELEWSTEHGDEAVFVQSGILDCDGRQLTDGSTLIVEAGASIVVRSVGVTQVVHFGTVAAASPTGGLLGGPAGQGRGIHVVRPQEAPSVHFGGGDNATSVYFADGTCRSCRIALFLYDGSIFAEGYAGASHFHSEDEIMHVLDGELHVGPLTVARGACIAVPQNVRYCFRTSGPFRYLGYRADVSTAVVQPGTDPVLETVANLTSTATTNPVRTNSR